MTGETDLVVLLFVARRWQLAPILFSDCFVGLLSSPCNYFPSHHLYHSHPLMRNKSTHCRSLIPLLSRQPVPSFVFGFLQIRSGICSGQPHIRQKNVVPKQLALCFIFRNFDFMFLPLPPFSFCLFFFQTTVGVHIHLFSGPSFFCSNSQRLLTMTRHCTVHMQTQLLPVPQS